MNSLISRTGVITDCVRKNISIDGDFKVNIHELAELVILNK